VLPALVAADGADDVVLRADGLLHRGWTSLRIERGIESAAGTFSVSVAGSYQDEATLEAGSDVEVWAGATRLVTGYVDAVNDDTDSTRESVSISGRSRTCDAIDCSAPIGVWRKRRLADLLDVFLRDYAIDVVDEAGVADEVIAMHRTAPGESIFDALDRIGRDRGIMLTDDSRGRLVLTRAGLGGRASTAIVRGKNVIASSGAWDLSDRFSVYEVKGQTVLDLDVDAAATGQADDPRVLRFRRLVIVPENGGDKASARRRAAWEGVTRAGKSFGASYTLRGWRQDDGTLWRPNQLVTVTDRRFGLDRAELLITRVALVLDADSGRKVELTVAPASGFTPPPTQTVPSEGHGRWLGEVEGTTAPAASDGPISVRSSADTSGSGWEVG
jgi:prophage tail gpP-like protein